MVHIVPKNDSKTHTLDSKCECKPELITDSATTGGTSFYLHNSFSSEPPPIMVGGLLDGRKWQAFKVSEPGPPATQG